MFLFHSFRWKHILLYKHLPVRELWQLLLDVVIATLGVKIVSVCTSLYLKIRCHVWKEWSDFLLHCDPSSNINKHFHLFPQNEGWWWFPLSLLDYFFCISSLLIQNAIMEALYFAAIVLIPLLAEIKSIPLDDSIDQQPAEERSNILWAAPWVDSETAALISCLKAQSRKCSAVLQRIRSSVSACVTSM